MDSLNQSDRPNSSFLISLMLFDSMPRCSWQEASSGEMRLSLESALLSYSLSSSVVISRREDL